VATVDEPRLVFEYKETNNRLVQSYTAPQGAPAPSGPTQPDLMAGGLLVRSAEQGGSDSCEPGRNDVSVVIRNDGAAVTESFAVRLIVDDDNGDAREQVVSSLEANAQQDITFQDIRLRQGSRDVKAVVDAKKAIAESDEDNNDVEITFNCRDR
jgi:hypothetical protein